MLSASRIHLGVICPMANEGQDGVRFVEAALEQSARCRKTTFFAVLDKVTTDNSVELLREYARIEPRLEVVWAPENRNVVDAYVRGYREAVAAGCDWILEIDAGFSHRPEQIPTFLRVMEDGYDCVFGSRFAPGGSMERSLKRYLVSRGGTLLANLLLGTRLSDMTSGYELFSHSALSAVLEIGIQSRAHFFQTEIRTYCRNLRFAEVPIHYKSPSPRLGSSSIKDAFHQLWRLTKLRWAGKLPDITTDEIKEVPGCNLNIEAEPHLK